jgi:hypothetical protein
VRKRRKTTRNRTLSRALTLAGAALQVVIAAIALGFAQPWDVPAELGGSAPSGAAIQEDGYRTALTPDGRGIVRRPPAEELGREALDAIPAYDPANKPVIWQVDLRRYDLRALDLRDRLADLLMAQFDLGTKWPRRLPRGFEPGRIIEIGKDPGLGVRALHKEGITGKGVNIAILDQTLLVDHVEYKDRLRLYEEIHCGDPQAQMHGPAVTSIAAGKTVGVAPGADVYYIAETHGHGGPDGFQFDFTYLARAIDRIREINQKLPEGRKIRALSISVGWEPQNRGFAEANAAVERAQSDGIFVISMSLRRTSGGRFILGGLGRSPLDDPDALSSVKPGQWWTDIFYTGKYAPDPEVGYLLVPMDSRTTAGPAGSEDYAFYRIGGASWTAPWIAGLYALACQVDPGVTPELFWKTALETGDSIEFPPRKNPLTEEEIEKRAVRTVDQQMARFGDKLGQGAEREKRMAEIYNQATGKKVERMSEAEFRAWGVEVTRQSLAESDKPIVLEKIVNPGKLIAALKK